jgi:hypothetical protein
MLYEVGKGCAEDFVREQAEAALFAGVLRERGAQGECRRREGLIDSQGGGYHANDGSY